MPFFFKKSYTDAEYLEAIINDKQPIITRLYAEQEKICKASIIRQFSKLRSDIDDIYVDAFERMEINIRLARLTAENLTVPLGGYLHGIAYKVAQEYLRKKELILKDNIETEQSGSDDAIVSPFTETSWEQHLYKPIFRNTGNDSTFSDNDIKLIRLYVTRLTEKCRDILRLFYYEELSMSDIATRLNYKNANTAKTQKNKCMTKLINFIRHRIYGTFDADRTNR